MSRENVELVLGLVAASSRASRDIPAALSYLDPAVEWLPHRAATEGAYLGHEGFERFMADTDESFDAFEPSFEFEEADDRLVAWGTIRIRGKGSGIDTEVPVGGVFDFRDGKILRWQDYGSKQAALEAAGRA